jgi:hypothetical protein
MSISKHLPAACLAAALALFSAHGQAHSTFPTLIAAELDMPCVPACTICHKDTVGGFGTVTEPFGKAMQADGLFFTEASLSPALKKHEAAGTDVDGDGEGDVAELRVGQDPNGTIDLCSQAALAARYGCGAHIATPPAQCDTGATLSALFTVLVLGASLHRVRARSARRATKERHNQ